ncbi:hypothetical protein KL921_003072 [Ogataea angusta]|uniref:SWR1-complex protein 5 n=1 Tax=Pichia angusta TaxID=870730 RepID=A0ABQ7RTU5_PICAN|nr:hypothetical protein KL921_003072 [Ogataea angusta]KAG7824759.1 hypothetical protein KL909_001981 [Ogataea angusta]KAG7840127.1 hypothetical protein KL942_002926 [Ogataea angusta]KAG7847456.1 hypothetical protein KL940_003792 [Ogataea angusta]
MTEEQKKTLEDSIADYQESEDEDYNPEAKDDDDDEEEGFDDEPKYRQLESGGLIQTRRQRQAEKHEKTYEKPAESTIDVDSIWKELNKPKEQPKSEPKKDGSTPSSTESADTEKIKITRTYEFAGEMVTEEKWVDANSEEARAHFNSTKLKESKETSPERLLPKKKAPKRKRASLLDDVINNASSAKLTTLEKSRLDWATYVDKSKIGDELKFENKGGYLDQQDFLSRVSHRQDTNYKEAKKRG